MDIRTDIFAYLRGHLPGAVYLNTETLRASRGGIPTQLLDAPAYAALFSRIGLPFDRPVVVYSAGETHNIDATFLAWLLAGFGHRKVYLLDGGYFKWQLPKGVVKCLFRGSAGTVTAGSVTPINDGQWHTVRCERTATAVTMTVDGEVTRRKSGATGNIANSKPLSIGGKVACDQVDVTCDYWVGRIDWVKIQASAPS